MVLILPFLPKSPIWLAHKGRCEEARKALVFFKGKHANVEEELEAILAQLKLASARPNISWRELLTKSIYGQPLMIGSMTFILGQASGVAAVVPYIVEIFIRAGFQEDKSKYYGAAVAAAQVRPT